jgi:hypothetical protein
MKALLPLLLAAAFIGAGAKAAPDPASPQNSPATSACVEALTETGFGAPDQYSTACGGVQDTGGVAAVVSCYRRLDGSGVTPDDFARACAGVKDSAGVEAVVACAAELKEDRVDSKSIAVSCGGAGDMAAAEAVSFCRHTLGDMGEDSASLDWACRGVKDAAGVDGVAACHAKLKSDGVEFKFVAAACGGALDGRAAEAVSSCMKTLGALGEEPAGLAAACHGVRDAAGVDAVAACHVMLKSDGIDPEFFAASCGGVPDMESAEAVASCHRKRRDRGADPVDSVLACRDAINASPIAVKAAPGASVSSGTAGAPLDDYATDCARLPKWLSTVPDSAAELRGGPQEKKADRFDAKGPLFVVAARAPRKGDSLVARDLRREAATVRVSRVLKNGFQIRPGGKPRTLRLCPSPSGAGAAAR